MTVEKGKFLNSDLNPNISVLSESTGRISIIYYFLSSLVTVPFKVVKSVLVRRMVGVF